MLSIWSWLYFWILHVLFLDVSWRIDVMGEDVCLSQVVGAALAKNARRVWTRGTLPVPHPIVISSFKPHVSSFMPHVQHALKYAYLKKHLKYAIV